MLDAQFRQQIAATPLADKTDKPGQMSVLVRKGRAKDATLSGRGAQTRAWDLKPRPRQSRGPPLRSLNAAPPSIYVGWAAAL